MKDVVAVSKQIFSKDELSKTMKLRTTKLRSLVVDVIGTYTAEKIAREIGNGVFSILVDESTDISNSKHLCILVRYFFNGAPRTHVLDMVEIEADGATRQNMFKSLEVVMENYQLSFNNIVGFCSDNARSMMGVNEGLVAYILKENKNVFVLGCICYTTHLIAIAAAVVLPRNVESLLHLICSYFSRSPKRQKILEDIQESPSRTRWLALHSSIVRVAGFEQCVSFGGSRGSYSYGRYDIE